MRKTLNGEVCFKCGKEYALEPHEPYRGRNKQLSIKYGMVLAFCHWCHEEITLNPTCESDVASRAFVRKHFEETYPHLDFIQVFK